MTTVNEIFIYFDLSNRHFPITFYINSKGRAKIPDVDILLIAKAENNSTEREKKSIVRKVHIFVRSKQ